MLSKTQKQQGFLQSAIHSSHYPNPTTPFPSPDLITKSTTTASPIAHHPINYNYPQRDQQQKIIPGYNFQSLFRKKSHIRLSKKKNKEQTIKRSLNSKNEIPEKESKDIQKGHWTNQENKLYHFFLEIHNKHFIMKHLRRTDKIFKSMANFLNSRQAEQCRSHHQKMEKKYHNFYQILIKLRMDFYNTLNPQQLIHQMEEKGYKIIQNTVIGEEQLKNGDLGSKLIVQKNDEISIGESRQVSQQSNNILSQNYENALQFTKINFQH